jgi:hypothetical protein
MLKMTVGEQLTLDGMKYDEDKPSYTLIPANSEEAVAKVLTFGAKKYDRDNWKKVNNAEWRYVDAALRHISSHRRGETIDPESGLPHLAHAICSLYFLLELEHGKTWD